MSKFAKNVFRRSLPNPGSGTLVPDLAVRINLLGSLFFGLMIFVPEDTWELRRLFGGGVGDVLMNCVAILLFSSVVSAIWFFFVNMTCSMAGGGRPSTVAASIGSGIAIGLLLLRISLIETV